MKRIVLSIQRNTIATLKKTCFINKMLNYGFMKINVAFNYNRG